MERFLLSCKSAIIRSGVWIYWSYQEFFREAAEVHFNACKYELTLGESISWEVDQPPVILAEHNEAILTPRLRGRLHQKLPRIAGQKRSNLSISTSTSCNSADQRFNAWLVPWRFSAKKVIEIEIIGKNRNELRTILTLYVESQPSALGPSSKDRNEIYLSDAAKFLELVPGSFETESSLDSAFCRIENLWNDRTPADKDPARDLLQTHASQLRDTLDSLCAHPRSILRTEHSMLKLQKVRRINTKTLRWLSGQPGRNTAERAGTRQRIQAPKRYDTIDTLENKVLRAFAALTFLETENWIDKTSGDHSAMLNIRSHQFRVRRVETMLQERNVSEAIPPVTPNFALRFDRHYRAIWKAWLELRKLHEKSEIEWMWHHRTFMELLVVQAAMKLHQVIRKQHEGGILAFTPVLEAASRPNQGHYLHEIDFRCTFGFIRNGSFQTVDFRNSNEESQIGTVATAGQGLELWWNDFNPDMGKDNASNNQPWYNSAEWDKILEIWAKKVIA